MTRKGGVGTPKSLPLDTLLTLVKTTLCFTGLDAHLPVFGTRFSGSTISCIRELFSPNFNRLLLYYSSVSACIKIVSSFLVFGVNG